MDEALAGGPCGSEATDAAAACLGTLEEFDGIADDEARVLSVWVRSCEPELEDAAAFVEANAVIVPWWWWPVGTSLPCEAPVDDDTCTIPSSTCCGNPAWVMAISP